MNKKSQTSSAEREKISREYGIRVAVWSIITVVIAFALLTTFGVGSVAANNPDVNVSLQPTEQQVAVGEEAEVDIVAESANWNDLIGYQFDFINITNTSVAKYTHSDVTYDNNSDTFQKGSAFSDVGTLTTKFNVTDDKSRFKGAFAANTLSDEKVAKQGEGSLVIGTIYLDTLSGGTTEVVIPTDLTDPEGISDIDNDKYNIININNATITVVDPSPNPSLSNLAIAGQGTDATVSDSDTADVGVDIENIGDEAGNLSATLTIENSTDAEVVNTTQTTSNLSVGENETLTYSNAVDGLPGDDYTVNISAGDQTVSGSLTVKEEGSLTVAINDTQSTLSVTESEQISVVADIENTGDTALTQDITASVSGSERANITDLTLAGGETTQETLTFTAEAGDDGQDVTVSSADQSDTTALSVVSLTDLTLDVNESTLLSGETTNASVVANYSDGTSEIVTPVSTITSNDSSVVSPVEVNASVTANDSIDRISVSGGEFNIDATNLPTESTINFGEIEDGVLTGTEALTVTNDKAGKNITVGLDVEDLSQDTELRLIPDKDLPTIPVAGTEVVTLQPGESIDLGLQIETGTDTFQQDNIALNITAAPETGANLSASAPGTASIEATFEGQTVSDELTVLEEGELNVTIDEQQSTLSVAEGEDISVVADIENTGGTALTQDIVANVSGATRASSTVTLSGGETTQETLTFTAEASDDGQDVTVSSADQSDTTALSVVSLTDLTLDVNESTLLSGETTNASVVANYSDGSSRDVTAEANITANDTAVVSITELNTSLNVNEDIDRVTVENGNLNIDATNLPEESTVSFGEFSDNELVGAGAFNVTNDQAGEAINLGVELQESPGDTEIELVADDPDSTTIAGGSSDTISVADGETIEFGLKIHTGTETIDDRVDFNFTAVSQDGIELGADSAGAAEVTAEFGDLSDRTTVTVEEPLSPANFNVTIDGTNAPVDAGEVLTTTATVTNDGDESGSQDITLANFNDTVVDTNQSLSLASGASETVTLRWDTAEADAGTDNITVSSANETVTQEVTLAEQTTPANFSVDIERAPTEVTAGEPVEVEANITNVGDQQGIQTISLNDTGFDNTEVNSTSVTLESGASTTQNLTWNTENPADVGSGDLTVSSANDSATTSITVTEPLAPASFNVTIDESATNNSVDLGDEIRVVANITNDGGKSGSQDITLDFGQDGQTDDTVAVTSLGSGQSTEVTLTHTVSTDTNAGDTIAEVSSANDSDTASVTVTNPAELSFNDQPLVNGNVTIENVTSLPDQKIFVTYSVSEGEGTPTYYVAGVSDGDSLTDADVSVEVGDQSNIPGNHTARILSNPGSYSPGDTISADTLSESESARDEAKITEPQVTELKLDINETDLNETDTVGLNVTANYTDGRSEDVTSAATISSDNTAVATVDNASVTAVGSGTANITAEFQGETDATQVTVDSLAEFDVTINTVDDDVTAGVGTISVDYTVENIGDLQDTQQVTLTVDQTQQSSQSVTLAGGSSTEGTFEYPTARDDDPSVTIEVASENDSASQEATVNPSDDPSFEFTTSNINQSVTTGDDIVATYEIDNTGTFSATQTVDITAVNGNSEEIFSDSTTLTLNGTEVGTAGGEDVGIITERISDVDAADKPNITVTAETANDTRKDIVTVNEPGNLVIDAFDSDASDDEVVGNLVEFDGVISNTGDLQRTTEVSLLNETGTVLDSTGTLVRGGSTKAVNFEYQLTDSDDRPGDTNFTLSINNQQTNSTLGFNVTQPSADFNITDASVIDPAGQNANASAGDRITISVDITNTGTKEGTLGVTLNGSYSAEPDNRSTLTLASDETGTVELRSDQIPATAEGTTTTFTVATPSNQTEIDIGVNASAEFNVSIDDAPDTVTAGDDIEIAPTITNDGGESATETINTRLGGVLKDSTDISLASGDSTTSNITIPTTRSDGGENVEIQLASPADSDTVTIDVNRPAAFEITNTDLSPSQPVQGSDELQATVTVENTGDIAGTANISASLDNGTVSSESTISGGTSDTVTLNLSTANVPVGEQSVLITAENTGSGLIGSRTTRTTTIREPADVSVGIDSVTNPVVVGNSLTVEATLRNDGGVASTETVNFSYDGTQMDNRSDVTVPADGSTEVTFAITPASTATSQTVAVEAGQATDTRSIDVIEKPSEAQFQTSGLTVDDTTNTDAVLRNDGEDTLLYYNVTVENLGDGTGTGTVQFMDRESGEVLDDKEVTLDAGDSTQANLSVDPDDLTTGDRTLGVGVLEDNTVDSSQNKTVTVRAFQPAELDVAIEDDVDQLATGETVNATIENTGDATITDTIEFELLIDGSSVLSTSPAKTFKYGQKSSVTLDIDDKPRAGNFSGELRVDSGDTVDTAETTVDFGTVNDALDAASSGDRVTLAPETYSDGAITVGKPVTIDGPGAVITNTTTITASDPVTITGVGFREVESEAAVTINAGASESRIHNTRFGSSVDYGINTSADNVVIENNDFVSNKRAIDLKGTTGTEVLQNDIFGSTTAINVTGDDRFNYHVIDDNNIEPSDVAIRATGLDTNDGEILAENNWWGRPSGPIDGEEILSPVDFTPWQGDRNDPADYQIAQTNLTNITDLTQGEQVSISANITNVGGINGDTTDRLVLELDGNEKDSIAFDHTTTGTRALQFTPSEADAKSLDQANLTLSTDDDSVRRGVSVDTVPAFSVSITDAPATIESDQTLTVDAEIDNIGQATGKVTGNLFFDGTSEDSVSKDIAGGQSETVTLSKDLSASDEGVNIPIEVTAGAGSDTTIVDVEDPSPSSSDSSDSSDSSGGPGGLGGLGGSGGEDPESGPPTVQDIKDMLKLANPNADITTEIGSGPLTESVIDITFDNEDAAGSVTITDYTKPAQTVRDDVAESVTAAGAVNMGSDDSLEIISVHDITPEGSLEESSATVTFSIPADEVNNPKRVTIVKETYDFAQQETTWKELETTLKENGDEKVTVTAKVDEFSLFAITEIDGSDTEIDGSEDPNPDPTPPKNEDDSELASQIVILVLTVLVIYIGYTARSLTRKE